MGKSFRVRPVGQSAQALVGRLLAAGHESAVVSEGGSAVSFVPFSFDGSDAGWVGSVEAHFSCVFDDVQVGSTVGVDAESSSVE